MSRNLVFETWWKLQELKLPTQTIPSLLTKLPIPLILPEFVSIVLIRFCYIGSFKMTPVAKSHSLIKNSTCFFADIPTILPFITVLPFLIPPTSMGNLELPLRNPAARLSVCCASCKDLGCKKGGEITGRFEFGCSCRGAFRVVNLEPKI